jgi:hypothetical protein
MHLRSNNNKQASPGTWGLPGKKTRKSKPLLGDHSWERASRDATPQEQLVQPSVMRLGVMMEKLELEAFRLAG